MFAGALQSLHAQSGQSQSDSGGWWSILSDVGFVLAAVVAGGCLVFPRQNPHRSRLGLRPYSAAVRVWPGIGYFVLWIVAIFCGIQMVIGGGAQYLIQQWGGAVPNKSFDNVSMMEAISSSIRAGVSEEVLIVAVPVVLVEFYLPRLRDWTISKVPAGWILIICALTAYRLAFHLYQGLEMTVGGFLFWAAASAVCFILWRQLWPLIIAHVMWDLWSQLPTFQGWGWGYVLGAAAILGAAATIMLGRAGQLRPLSFRQESVQPARN